MLFSPSTLGFYPEGVQYAQLPDDLIEVSNEVWEKLRGRHLEVGDDGMPREYVPNVPASAAPASVTMRQARLALLQAGKLAAVNAAIAAMPSPAKEAAQIEWEFASHVERQSPFLQGLASALDLDDDELDQLFVLAASK